MTPSPLTPDQAAALIAQLQERIGRRVVGHHRPLFELTLALACGGHCLIEGVPGLGKTLLVRTVAATLGLAFARIQCTPDLMPGDITGTGLLIDERGHERFQFQPGPIFANLVLADEINRATPRTQSALLEAMQEGQVTVMGETHRLPSPFLLLATQNPIEMEGTYPLPEAQLDRFFFKIHLNDPAHTELKQVMTATMIPATDQGVPLDLVPLQATVDAVLVPDPVADYAVRLILASRPDGAGRGAAALALRLGISPRGGQCLVRAARAAALARGRHQVDFADLREVALPALRHRLLLHLEAEMEGLTPDQVVANLLEEVPP
jgi:MoxR-like ATPase